MRFVRYHTLIVLVLMAAASPAAQPTARLELTPDTVLTDEPFRIALTGLKPNQDVTIRADGGNGVWHSSASFRADEAGRVDVADPMKFVWSAVGDGPPAGPL